ncbi:hypothetical protein TNCV_4752501 [Trichonephila clavipes]|nr:hypothetical protein TNCV_4752501 [Trichonephila clavipes]
MYVIYSRESRPFGVMVSDADYCVAGPGFESRRRHGCLKMYSAFAAWRYSKQRRAASPLVRLVAGEERRGGRLLTPPMVFSLKIGVESS